MKILRIIKTRKKVSLETIWRDVEISNSIIKYILGIMFRKKILKPVLFIFNKENPVSIHSFFCVPFDIIYMNKFGKIIKIIENVKSNKLLPSVYCKYIIECKPGKIKKKKIKKGDILLFK